MDYLLYLFLEHEQKKQFMALNAIINFQVRLQDMIACENWDDIMYGSTFWVQWKRALHTVFNFEFDI